MGCGGSRLGGLAGEKAQEGGGIVPIPAGIRPLLRRRLEEMKKRSHASVLKGSQTSSKKELLRTGSSEDGEYTEENDGSLKSLAKIAPATPEHHVEEKKEVIYEKVEERDDVKEVKEEVVVKKEEEGDKEVVKNQEEGDKEEVKNQEEENHHQDDVDVKKEGEDGKNHDDVEGMMNSFDERMIGPGSPSFRVYCVDVPSDGEEKDGEDTKKTIETETVTTELKEEQSSVKNEKNRERKGRRFGIALPRKYLANVTAPCMGNNTHNTRIVQEKSSQ